MIEDHCGSVHYGATHDEAVDGEPGPDRNSTRKDCVSKMHVNATAFVAYLNRTSFVWPPDAPNSSETIEVNPPGVYNIYNFRKVFDNFYLLSETFRCNISHASDSLQSSFRDEI